MRLLLKEIMKKMLVNKKCESILEYSNIDEDDELKEFKEFFPEFNYHKHYHDKLYKCHKCNEYLKIDKIYYISVEMFEAEYYYCRNCTSKKIVCMENINERI
ncbi:hypothetical protein RZE82_07770 [Mollicutes bacterium LVI A0039]|nr:hypothetical protein RZE82_07770 [Mollicutes bacterium LVI A0039]